MTVHKDMIRRITLFILYFFGAIAVSMVIYSSLFLEGHEGQFVLKLSGGVILVTLLTTQALSRQDKSIKAIESPVTGRSKLILKARDSIVIVTLASLVALGLLIFVVQGDFPARKILIVLSIFIILLGYPLSYLLTFLASRAVSGKP
jgi:DMSO reductase anchor subunit